MAVFNNNNAYVSQTAVFDNSATSTIVELSGACPVAIVTPASFGQTTITFTAATTRDGTYYPVYDSTGTLITLTVSSSSASWTDITTIFPASVGGWVKLVTGGAITKNVEIVSRNMA